VKKRSLVLSVLLLFFGSLIVFSSCKKINEATELGGDLIPPVDNISTFETSLLAETDNFLFNDTTKVLYNNPVALGNITNDPVFGKTNANLYFNVGLSTYGTNPFVAKDSVLAIDSVVLSLGYTGSYGDSTSLQTVRVFEIDPLSEFTDTSIYTYSHPDFATTGSELGSKAFTFSSLKDSLQLIRKDTQRVANVLRIRLDNSLGSRFAGLDTTNTANGGFRTDSIFKTLFRGFAVKADATAGNSLGNFNLSDQAKTKLTVFFRGKKNGVVDTGAVDFFHTQRIISSSFLTSGGQANTIKRTPAGEWAAALNNSTTLDEKLYLQSTPGSYATIRIPALDTLTNKVIYLAELIIERLPSSSQEIFTPPSRLFLDKINNARDTAATLENDFPTDASGALNFTVFGGTLRSDNTYRFNITRHVQGIVTRKEPNKILRLYAPVETTLFVKNLGYKVSIPVMAHVAEGRVVVAGGNHPDSSLRMRVRLVYSKI
jgi:hypothetical protein